MESPVCPADLRLIETFGWTGRDFVRLEAHLARAARSAAVLGFEWRRDRIDAALSGIGGAAPLRVRLTVARDGTAEATAAPLAPAPPVWQVMIAPERLDPAAPMLAHKTTDRALYDRTRANLPEGVDEALFVNLGGALCEGTITNIFADLGTGLLTPPLSAGCLPGILRAELIASGAAREATLTPEALTGAALFVGNALRGLIPARLVGPDQGRGDANG